MEVCKGTILVVDDEKANCNVLISLLEGYRVLVAKNGHQALERAENNAPDLILLDVVMPGMSGHEVCKALKSNKATHHIPVIFVTVKSTIEEETQGLELGAVDYISKPFSPSIVQARVANHIQLKKQRDLLESLNITDSLTGISNRRHFDQSLQSCWKAAMRSERCISLLMVDIDHFKQFNDHYGHAGGDSCLVKVAQTLAAQGDRDLDVVCRYGGEEFAVILPYTDHSGAEFIAERMLNAVRDLQIPHLASPSGDWVTVSIGMASMTPDTQMKAAALLEAADIALYSAKQGGRNRSAYQVQAA